MPKKRTRRPSPTDGRLRKSTNPLTNLRVALGKSKADIGREIGVHASAISYWESLHREPKPHLRTAYAHALRLTRGELGRIIYEAQGVSGGRK